MTEMTLVVPSGWAAVDLRRDTPTAVADMLTATLSRVPADRLTQVRDYAKGVFTEQVAQLQDAGAFLLLMAPMPLAGSMIQPQVVLARWELPDDAQPMDVLLALASKDGSASIVEAGELVGLRISSTLPRTDDFVDTLATQFGKRVGFAETELLELQVRYFIGPPQDRNRWVSLQCSMLYPRDPEDSVLLEQAYGFFDALVQTIEWQRS